MGVRSEDPIGFLEGVNFYRYVDNDPTNATDPMGLQAKPTNCTYGNWVPTGGTKRVYTGAFEAWFLVREITSISLPVVTGKGGQSPAPGWSGSGGGNAIAMFCLCEYEFAGMARRFRRVMDAERTVTCQQPCITYKGKGTLTVGGYEFERVTSMSAPTNKKATQRTTVPQPCGTCASQLYQKRPR